MKGTVIKSTGKWYTVRTPEKKDYTCTIKGKFRVQGIRSTNPVAVGDHVEFQAEQNEHTGIIHYIEERNNYLIRKSTNLSKQSHIIAANIDQSVIVVTVNYPETYPGFIDRYLVTTEAYRIPSVIVFNKIDLYNDEEKKQLDEYINIYENIGYPCLLTSATHNKGIGHFRHTLQNKTSVITGNSGVGKSSLINQIDPDVNLKIGDISGHYKTGKHTTTFPEMVELSCGGYIIDTPGIKGFGLVHIEKEEIFHFFPEIFKYSHACKFHNCMHTDEPGCAVKEAMDEGHISISRYKSYIDMLMKEEGKYR